MPFLAILSRLHQEVPGTSGSTVFLWVLFGSLLCGTGLSAQDLTATHLVTWGEAVGNSQWNEGPAVQIAAGFGQTAIRRSDGSVVAWGDSRSAQCNVPTLPPGLRYAQVAVGGQHAVARRSDGSVLAWGNNLYGQCNVPLPPPAVSYLQLAAGSEHTVALRSDGSVLAWGDNSYGQCNAPPLPPGLSYVEVAAGGTHTLARRSDGSVLAWGDNSSGQCSVPSLPSGMRYVQIAGGGTWNGPLPYSTRGHSLALRSDGMVVAWGDDTYGQRNVPTLPTGLSDLAPEKWTPNSESRGSGRKMFRWATAGSTAASSRSRR